jgi:hypothetical protein
MCNIYASRLKELSKNMLPETSAAQQTIIASEHSSDYVSALLSKGLVDIKVFPLFCLTCNITQFIFTSSNHVNKNIS